MTINTDHVKTFKMPTALDTHLIDMTINEWILINILKIIQLDSENTNIHNIFNYILNQGEIICVTNV